MYFFNNNPDTLIIIEKRKMLKGLSHEIDFDNIEKNLRMLALINAAAGFRFFQMHL